jgi:hypothetical protein
VLLAQEVVGGVVHGPRHVVLTPVVRVFGHFFLALLTILWRLFLPGFILLLFLLVVSILLVLLLVLLVVLFLSFICNSDEFGVQLELTFERIKGGSHRNNLLVDWKFSSPEYFGLQPVELAFCGHHEGLVIDGGEFTVKVILMLLANVRLEVVAGNQKVSFKQDADGVVNSPGC